jgi:hypothetical protein
MNQIKLTSIEILTADRKYAELYHSEPTNVPYFEGKELVFEIEVLENISLEKIDETIANFLAKDTTERAEITKYIADDCRNFIAEVGFEPDMPTVINNEDVWRYVYPKMISVGAEYFNSNTVYLRIWSDCGWETEHGLDILYKEGKDFVGFGIAGTNIVDIEADAKILGII